MKEDFKKLIVLFIIFGLLVGLYFIIKGKELTSAEKFAEEYPVVTKDNVFVYKDIEEIIELLENGTGVVYLGFPECPWCQSYVKILNDVAKEEGLKEIYYFNIAKDREDDTDNYKRITKILKEYLYTDSNSNPRVLVPDVTGVRDGKIVGHDNETSDFSGGITPEEYWTDEHELLLKAKLKDIISKVSEKICTNCN